MEASHKLLHVNLGSVPKLLKATVMGNLPCCRPSGIEINYCGMVITVYKHHATISEALRGREAGGFALARSQGCAHGQVASRKVVAWPLSPKSVISFTIFQRKPPIPSGLPSLAMPYCTITGAEVCAFTIVNLRWWCCHVRSDSEASFLVGLFQWKISTLELCIFYSRGCPPHRRERETTSLTSIWFRDTPVG